MEELLESWNQPVANSYDPEELADGYVSFAHFRKSQPDDTPLEKVYIEFVKRFGHHENTVMF